MKKSILYLWSPTLYLVVEIPIADFVHIQSTFLNSKKLLAKKLIFT